MSGERRIAHLDMDAFFASVELLHYPQLRGLPVVVGGRRVNRALTPRGDEPPFIRLRDYVGRGVVTTSTYEARKFGVFSGMGLMQSARLAPEAILLPANFEAYRHYSRLFKAAVAGIAPRIEDRGVDEIYIDLSGLAGQSQALAQRIRAAVFAATGLSCSLGIAPNKLLAKIGSDLEKPNGITILDEGDVIRRIWPLPAAKINGIGPKSAQRLASLGLRSIGDLAQAPVELLIGHFGQANGQWMHRVAHGIDDRPLTVDGAPKSISRESTFERDLHVRQDKAALSEIFTDLCHRLGEDLCRRGYACRTVGIKLRYADFRAVTRDMTLPAAARDGAEIRRAAGACLKRLTFEQKIRLLGVRASGLCPMDGLGAACAARQMDLGF